MKTKNSIPKGLIEVIALSQAANAGAQAVGSEELLAINTPAKIQADVHDLSGDPTTPLVPGKQARYVAQKASVAAAYAEGRVVVKAARSFCQLAIDILAPALGGRWNSKWTAVGFTAPSLAVPRQPVAMLIALREYLKTHTEREVAVLNITAADAQLHLEAVQSAHHAIAEARSLLVSLKAARDASLGRLRKRLSNLRAELAQVLSPSDGRWQTFGFRRPADGTQPAPVTAVTVTEVAVVAPGSGIALIEWKPAALAKNYRVAWKPKGGAEPAGNDSITAETQSILQNLPAGVPLIIAVSARNRSGETTPTEVEITI